MALVFTFKIQAAPGDLDLTFDGDGRVTTSVNAFPDALNDVQIRNGKTIASGFTTITSDASNVDFLIIQYNDNGSLDTSFGTGGILRTDFAAGADYSSSSLIQPDGKLVLAGAARNANPDFAAARYDISAPTAATVTVSGRVMTASGKGIARAMVSITDGGGNTRTATTNRAGFYQFTDVAAGETCVLSVKVKGYRFAQPTQVVFVNEDLENVNFTALP